MSRRKQLKPKHIRNEEDAQTPSGPTKNNNDAKDFCNFKTVSAFLPNGHGFHNNVTSQSSLSPADLSVSRDSPEFTESPSSYITQLKKSADHLVAPDDLNNNNANVTEAQFLSLTQNHIQSHGFQGQHFQGQGQSVFASGDSGSVLPVGGGNGRSCSQPENASGPYLSPLGPYSSPSRVGTVSFLPIDSPQCLLNNSADSGNFMLFRDGCLPRNTCHFCGAVKKGPADLQRHLRKHTGERPFICSLCNKAFKAKRSLQYHQYMHHGIEHKDTNICEKFSEARRRKVVVDHERELRSPVNKFLSSYYVLDGTTNKMEVGEPVKVLDLSKTPPSDEGENSMLPSGEKTPNDGSAMKENVEQTTSECVEVIDSRRNGESDVSTRARPEGNGHVERLEKSVQRDGCPDMDGRDTAEKHCDKSSNPAESDEDDTRTVKRLTRSQARMACLRRSEQDKDNIGTSLPAKIPKTDKKAEAADNERDERHGGEEEKERSTGERSDSCMEDATNNNIGEAVCDRACPYCGMNCARPSDMKRHLLVHMETKPFVCKVCNKAFKAHTNMLYHQKVVHDNGQDLGQGQTPTDQDVGQGQAHNDQFYLTSPMAAAVADRLRPQLFANQTQHNLLQRLSNQNTEFDEDEEEEEEVPKLIGVGNGDALLGKSGFTQLDTASPGEKGSTDSADYTPNQSVSGGIPPSLFSVASCSKNFPQSLSSNIDHLEAPSGGRSGYGGSDNEDEATGGRNFMIEYPSHFPGLKQQISIKNEIVLTTRLDGVNMQTGTKVSLYRCHMCGKMYNYLSKLQCHLSVHFERHLSFYSCPLCGVSFRFQLQLRRHIRTSHAHVTSHEKRLLQSASTVTAAKMANRQPLSEARFRNMFNEQGGADQLPTDQQHKDGKRESFQVKQEAGLAPSDPLPHSVPHETAKSEFEVRADEYPRVGHQVSPPSPIASLDTQLAAYSPSFQTGEFYHRRYRGSYVCRYCNKVFHRLFSLQRHERVHTGYKPCFCKDCGRGFSETRNLRHHIVRFHGDMPQTNMVKQVRRAILSGLSRTSQRLMPVTQDMIAEAYSEEEQRTNPGLKPVLPVARPQRSPQDRVEKAFSPVYPPKDTPQPQPRPEDPVAAPQEATTGGEPSQLASEIRQKESLGEDVTVVIPTDVPLDLADSSMEAPRSNVSDNASWGENASDTDSSQSNEIVTAPWKSIMLHKSALKSKRKGKLPHRLLSPMAANPDPELHHSQDDPQPARRNIMDDFPGGLERPPVSDPHTHSSNPIMTSTPIHGSPVSTINVLPQNMSSSAAASAASECASKPPVAAITPSGPHMYLGHSPLLPPGVVPGQLPMMPTSMAASILAQNSGYGLTSGSPLRLSHPSWPSPSDVMSSEEQERLAAYSRGSSLSRTHSRLNVVRSPVRREEVCKPTVLPDGRTVYRCTYCNKDFGSFSDINRHMDFHEGILPGLGDAPSLGTWTKSLTTPHLAKRSRPHSLASASLGDIRPYKCKFCDYYARTNSQLKVHMMRHQGIREFHCKLCNYKGVTQSDLNRHMKSQIHMMKAQNECRLCGEGFVSPKNMDKHLAMCQGPKLETVGKADDD